MSEPNTHGMVVVVDEGDHEVGVCEKLAAHQAPGVRHRAFSVLLFTGDGQVVLQRRAVDKYHFGGQWSNSCDGHPAPQEDLGDAARRRVSEELGVAASLTHVGSFTYQAVDAASGLVEHEVDHVFVGALEAEPISNPAEVAEVQYVSMGDLITRMGDAPDQFVPWLAPVLALVGERR
jgi:isopentenyl-diphosphate delta-isomerase